MAKTKSKASKLEITNRKAKFEYSFVQEYDAGIVLTGTEIKSLRANNANINDVSVFKSTLVGAFDVKGNVLSVGAQYTF